MFQDKIWDFGYEMIVSIFVAALLAVFWALSEKTEERFHARPRLDTYESAWRWIVEQWRNDLRDVRIGLFVRVVSGVMAVAFGVLIYFAVILIFDGSPTWKQWCVTALAVCICGIFFYIAIAGQVGSVRSSHSKSKNRKRN